MIRFETVSAEPQMRPFNLAQLIHMIATLEQCRQGFNESSVAGLVDYGTLVHPKIFKLLIL